MFSFSTREECSYGPALLCESCFHQRTPGKGNRSGIRASTPPPAAVKSEWKGPRLRWLGLRFMGFPPYPNGNPIALPGRRSKQIAGNPGPGVPEAGQDPDLAREEGPCGPRSPLTQMPPAAAAATAPAAPPRAGHVAAGHAVARSVVGADSEGPRLRGSV